MGHRLIAVGVAVVVASPGGAVLDRSSAATALGSTRVGPTEVKYYGSITGEWLLTTRWNWPRWKHYPGDPCFYEREGNNDFRVVYTTNGRFVISPFKGGATIRTEGGKTRFSNLVLHSGTGTMVEHAEPGKEGNASRGTRRRSPIRA